MTKPFLDDLGMDSRLQHERGVSVAQVVEPNPFEAGSPSQLEPGMRDRIRQQWCAIEMSNHKVTGRDGSAVTLCRWSVIVEGLGGH